MKKESKNLKSITERNSKMTKVIDIDSNYKYNKLIDFEANMLKIGREIHLKICNDISKQIEKYKDNEIYDQILTNALKTLKIKAETTTEVSYYIPWLNIILNNSIKYFKEFLEEANKEINYLKEIFKIDEKDLINDPDKDKVQ